MTDAASLALSSFSLRKCHVTAAPTLSPILILSDSDTLPSLSNSVVIVETSLFSRHFVVPSFVQLSPKFSSTSITISSSDIRSSFLSSRNGLLFDFNVNTTTSPTTITSQIVCLSLSNITSHPFPTPSPFALSQSLVSSSLVSCSNHLSGSVTRDFNFGGSLLAQNTSFTSCTADPPPIPTVHDPSKNHFLGQKYASVQSLSSVSTGSIGFVKCTFNNFKSTTTAGGMSIGIHASSINCPFVISECNFVNFSSSGDPYSRGAVTIACPSGSSPSVLVQKSKFENCSVSGELANAGALRCDNCPSPTISSCNVTSCSAGQYAGGIYLTKTATLASVTNCRFSDCSAGSWGGAFRVLHDSSYEVSNTLFERCHTDSNGGAIDTSYGFSTVSVVLSRFDTCTSVNDGGGIYQTFHLSDNIPQAFTFNVDDCTFDSCSCGHYGAGMCLFDFTKYQKAKCTFKKVVFIKCHSELDGGALLVKDCHSAKMEDCVVQECSTKEVGGVRFYNLTSSTIQSTLFTNCSAGSAHGGAGFALTAGTDLTVTNTNFTKMRSERLGGALRMWTIETIKFEDCRFEDCVAEKEGGAGAFFFHEIVTTRTITLTRVTILDCHSTSSHTGGLFFYLAGQVVVSACTVEGSSCAVYGGGLRVQFAHTLSLSDSNFSSNEAGSSGGSVDTSTIQFVEVKNCSFSDSSAVSTGGGLVLTRHSTATVSNCTFLSCHSRMGGAMDINYPTTSVTLSRIVMKKCGADYAGGGLYCLDLETAKPALSVSDMDFGKKGEGEENTCGELGSNVFLLFKGSKDFAAISDWSECLYSSSPADGIAFTRDERLSAAFGVSETEVVLHHSILAEVHPFDDETMFVDGQNGLDESKCGLSTIPCATLPRGMEGVSDEGKIAIRTEAEISELMTLDKSVVWESTGGDRARVVLAEAGSVSIESHSLALVGLAFSAQPSSSTRARSVVTLPSGALTVNSCTFEGIHSSSSGSCIKATLDSTDALTITETDFRTCRSEGDGGAVGVALSGTATLRISQASFSGCRAGGRGGAIFADFSDISSAIQYALLQLTFGVGLEVNAAGVGKKGNNVFVVGSTVDRMILPSRWLGSFEEADTEDFFGKDGDKEEESLLRFLLLQEVWVGRGGKDETGTGSDSMPFLSLGKGLTRIVERGEELNTVSVLEEARIGGCVVVGKETGTAQTIRISSSESKIGKIVCEVEGGSVGGGRWEERRRMIVIKRSLVIVSSLTFELRGTSKQIVSVFVMSDNAELSLAECSLTTREVVKTSFVEVGSTGSLAVSDVSCSEGRFGGKGSVVVCVGSGRVEMREVEMTSCSFEGGGVVVGGSTRGIVIVDSLFRNCAGGSFGSLIRISVVGCSAEVRNCVFERCTTRMRMDEIADVGRAVGGGCVEIELGHRRSSTRSALHSSADLSISSFVSYVLINTSPHPSSPRNVDFVGGSGFLIVVSDSGDHVALSKVRVVDSVCEKMEGWGKRGFEGGVVVWRGQSLRLDRREMEVKGSSVGLVKI
ncbi:hypothetical protein BLNAU_3079 [Blattamonas nauphoetae]|uniref:Right handed beta helix domain-containing protein n=1 Tax=Blattamonas nauphoetae TaxID=2049346 RepID=A0ABQ9YE42_9EUKA|nr:hypothetical protein BLNAU_3079 [Blattamonas nauphoetae]